MSRECEICMHRSIIYNVCRIGGSWVDLPPEGKCDDWKPHKNVEIGMEIERARCLAIVEKVCRYVKAAHRALAAAARGKGLPDLSDAHLERLLDVSALAEEIERQIRGEK